MNLLLSQITGKTSWSLMGKLRSIRRGLTGSHFVKNTVLLMSGTVIAQAVVVCASPILSRLYDPKDFGVIGLFVAISGPISMVASWRYDLAIVLPEKDGSAVNLLALSCLIIVLVSGLSAGLIGIFGDWFARQLDSPDLRPLLWLLPFSIMCEGMYRAFSFWSTRRKSYKLLSLSQIYQSSSSVCVQCAAGLANFGAAGLVGGKVVGQAIAATVLGTQILRSDGKIIKNSLSMSKVATMAKTHAKFAKYGTPQTFVSTFSQAIPSIILSCFAGPAAVGYYWFTGRIINVPSNLIGGSVRKVFYQKASELKNQHKCLYPFLKKVTFYLAIVGFIPFVLILLFAPSLFLFSFGEQWNAAGLYARWLIINWYISFVSIPSVMLIPIIDLQKLHLQFEIVLLLFSSLAITSGAIFYGGIEAVAIYTIVKASFNFLFICFMFNISIKLDKKILHE